MTPLHAAALHVVGLTVLLFGALLLPGAGGALAAACVWAACVTIVARSEPSGIVSLPGMYLLLLGLFHLGLVVPVALGATSEAPSWLSSPQLGLALGLFSTATIAFTLGTFLHAPPRASEERAREPLAPQRQLFWMGCLVALVGATLLWIGIAQLGILSARYIAYYERALSEDVRFFGFGRMLFPIGLIIAAVGATRRQMFALAAGIAIVLGPLFVQGFRGPFIVHSMALLAVWANKDRRMARRLAGVTFAAAIVLVPAVRMARNEDANVLRAAGEVDPLAFILEAGGSLRPLVVTAEAVGSGAEPLWMGRSYASAARRVVPNLSARRLTTSALAPNAWATRQADPWVFERGGGIGFSGVAEPYLNFGVPGVVLVFVGLGILLHACDRWLRAGRAALFRAAIGAACFGFVLWTVRNDAMEVGRAIVLAAVTALGAWALARVPRAQAPADPELALQARHRASHEALE